MIHQMHSWTTFDGIAVFAQTWEPERTPKASIALLHGIGDHSGRFPYLVESLTAAGYAVSSFDQRGHGRTGGPRVHAPTYEALLRDIDRHLEKTRERYPGLPLLLYGHSFGGSQALCYVLSRAPRLAAVVASSPGLASGVPQPPMRVFMGKVLSRIAPTFRIPLGSPMSSVSQDPAWLEITQQDPFYRKTLSVRIAMEQLSRNRWILAQTAFPAPLLIMQGTADQHVDPETNIGFARRLGSNATLKVWEGLGHELHNELKRDEILRYVNGWLDAQLA